MPTTIPAQGTDNAVDSEPPFKVISRKDKLGLFPCSTCHADMEADPTPRTLTEAPHFQKVQHGNADIWCTTCHALDNRDSLRTLSNKPVGFDQSYRVCAQCHSKTYNDWRFGAHGKRVKRWRGGREIFNCAECHNPHQDLGIQPRKPMPPPGVRTNLQRQHRARHRGGAAWEHNTRTEKENTDGAQ